LGNKCSNFQKSNIQNKEKTKMKNRKTLFDLEERTKDFFGRVIDLCKKVPVNPTTKRQIEQLVASAGSIGANWYEASECESKKDFVHKVKISRKEAKECRCGYLELKDVLII
jgi:four helix bundle protein